MSRYRSTARFVSVPPGCAVGTAIDGQTFVSKRIVSPILRITDVREGTGGRVEFRTRKKHGVATTATFNVRAEGWHGTTDMAHPMNVTSGTVTAVDEYWLALAGTPLAASTFLHGQCWRSSDTLIDSEPEYTALMLAVQEAGGGIVEAPVGYSVLSSTLYFREGVSLFGQGVGTTYFFANDNLPGHVMQSLGVGNFSAGRFTIACNRQYQDPILGLHGMRFGEDDVTTYNVTLTDFVIEGAKGYGIGCQAKNSAFAGFTIKGKIIGAGSDGIDFKNRANENDRNEIDVEVQHFGLYKIGRSNFPAYELPDNPFTTVSGSPNVSVSHPLNNISVGIKVTFENVGTVDGINMASTGTVVSKISNGYVVAMGQNASVGITGTGGSGILEHAQQFSSGDAGVDIRGRGVRVFARVSSDLRARTGVRCRPGTALSNNGEGAVYSSVSAIVTNTNASTTNANGISVGAQGIIVPWAIFRNVQRGLFVRGTSADCIFSNIEANGCGTGASIGGNSNTVNGLTAYACTTGLSLVGGSVVDSDALPEDAFTSEIGSNVVNVELPGHGRTTGDLVTIENATIDHGVDPNVAASAITVVDGNNFTIVVGSTATEEGPFGGENASYSFGTIPTGTGLICNLISTHGCTLGINVGAGVTAAQMGLRQSNGDVTAATDSGTSTVWTPAL